MSKNRTFSFGEVFKRVWIKERYGPPQQPISDHRFAAVALFERHHESARKVLVRAPGEHPYIKVTTYHDGICSGEVCARVSEKAAERLINEKIVEENTRSSTPGEFVLTRLGKEKVVREWCNSISVIDCLETEFAITPETKKAS